MSFCFSKMTREALLRPRNHGLDRGTLEVASSIIERVKQDPGSLCEYAKKFDGWGDDLPLVYDREALRRDFESLDLKTRALIERVHRRIEFFAQAQRARLGDLSLSIDGGRAGHRFVPHRVAGCYAPGGRFSLPSSVLMTVVPAKVAGVSEIWVASPRPGPVLRAAAYKAGADALLAVGGAQAIAAMAYGVQPVSACDVIVGPGNRFVTAAKHLVRDTVAIDMLAGPSELLVLADGSADPDWVACDLLAQAEHDVDAWPVLLATDARLASRVQERLQARLCELAEPEVASRALSNGGFFIASGIPELLALSEQIAAEHVQLMLEDSPRIAQRLTRYGSLFVGAASAEVMADYGAGPNHVLPTGATARTRGGLSVLDFLSLRTWMQLDRETQGFSELVQDSQDLANLEGLQAHALAAKQRLGNEASPPSAD